jgi:hypothetical protein
MNGLQRRQSSVGMEICQRRGTGGTPVLLRQGQRLKTCKKMRNEATTLLKTKEVDLERTQKRTHQSHERTHRTHGRTQT